MADTTPIGIRVPDDIRDRIDELAEAEKRTRNNMILRLLTEAIEARELQEAS